MSPTDKANDVDALLNRLCHLMVAFERAIGREADGPARSPGLDMPSLAVLVSLDLFGDLRPTSIAELLGGTTSMTTKVLGRLERAGLVTRELGSIPEDRRAVTVSVTPEGLLAIAACERVLVELSVDLLAAMIVVDVASPPDIPSQIRDEDLPGERPPSTGAALAEFLRFVVEIDKPLLATIGGLHSLHPADPRGLLILSELDLRGPIRIGDLTGLIDRSRSTVMRLVRDLQDDGLVRRSAGPVDGDRRGVVLELSTVGRAVIRGAVAAIAAHLSEMRPSMRSLSHALSGERQGLGAPAR